MTLFHSKIDVLGMARRPASFSAAFGKVLAAARQYLRMQYILFLAFTLVAAVPVITLTEWVEHRAVRQQIDDARDKHLLLAHNLTAAVSRYVADVKAGFDLAISAFNSGDQAPGLKALLTTLEYRHICIVNGTTGVVERFMPGLSDAPGQVTTIKPELLAELHEELKKGGTVLTDLKRSADGRPAFFLLRQLPGGRIAYGVFGTDYLIRLQRAIAFGTHGHSAILDATGKVIAHPFQKWIDAELDLSKIPPMQAIAAIPDEAPQNQSQGFQPPVDATMAGRSGVMQFYSPAFHAEMIAAYASVPETHWGILVPQPMTELYEQAATSRKAAVGIAMLCLVAAAIASWWLARFLSRPLQAIGDAAGAISAGDLDARAPHFRGCVPRELHGLSDAFNRMVDELSRTNRDLADAATRAEAASRAKSEFLANMSHELRTPLNAILGFSEIMRDEMFGALGSPRYRGYAADIAKSSNHLISVISAILDLAKAEAGMITPEIGPVQMSEVFDLSVRLVERLAADKSITIGVELGPYLAQHAIPSDQGKLTQIVVNLLTNSTKFTEPGGTIRLTGERRGAIVRIMVRDNGVGIAAADLDKVMTPFGQVASAERSHDGFGLGLPVTKKLAEMLGGSLTLDSKPGEGTTVTIELPLVSENCAEATNQAA